MSTGFFHRLAERGIDPDEPLPLTPAEKVVRDLEGWLNRALRKPEGFYPRIPVRRFSPDGGDARPAERPDARAHAEAWWASAFAAVELDR